ncbi:MAG TPA: hypothetical protein PKY82_30200 [Pyrinomonadaceae bacterium]|nr:hypothetical protein [Pyrinomonadaceae bacterium]
MNENRISLTLSEADRIAITQAMQTLLETLQPHLIALDVANKRALAKMKDKSVPFVEKAIQYAKSNPEFVPPYLDVAEMEVDYKAFGDLNNLLRALSQIVANLDDTAVLCGSEAYVAALAYYNSVGQAAKLNVPNAKAIYEDLSVRFEAQKTTKKTGEDNKKTGEDNK